MYRQWECNQHQQYTTLETFLTAAVLFPFRHIMKEMNCFSATQNNVFIIYYFCCILVHSSHSEKYKNSQKIMEAHLAFHRLGMACTPPTTTITTI